MKRLLLTSTLSLLVISALSSPKARETSDGRGLTTSSDLDDLLRLDGVDLRRATESPLNISTEERKKPLQFSERTGRNVELSNNLRTARRIEPNLNFDGGKVITNRALDNGEMFEVLLEKLNSIWSGSIEVGVTPNSPDNFDFGGNCYFTECVLWKYSDYAAKRKVGDRIGVMKHENGSLDVFINGELHTSYEDVPETVYGYVDLYGRTEQVGDRIGVMKHEDGTMDVFINGELRTSDEDVPETVYGFVNLYGNAEQATIQPSAQSFLLSVL